RDVQTHFNDNSGRFFNWSGGNTDAARTQAAHDLASLLRNYHRDHPNDPIRVVCHSHGGNVALQSSHEDGVHIDELVTLGTPILPNYRPGPGVLDWTNISSTGDDVQTHPYPYLSANRTDPAAHNITLDGF